jgi:hypothetical protein
VDLIPDDNDILLVTSSDFPELTTFGEDRKDALEKAVGALVTGKKSPARHRPKGAPPSPCPH